jgi:hypothetical protein
VVDTPTGLPNFHSVLDVLWLINDAVIHRLGTQSESYPQSQAVCAHGDPQDDASSVPLVQAAHVRPFTVPTLMKAEKSHYSRRPDED